MNNQVGKKLSEIPVEQILEGMRVANGIKEEGIVRFTVSSIKQIHVDWDNGSWTRYKEGDCGDLLVVETDSYSKKPLSQVPYDQIEIGLEVLSAIKTQGTVKEKFNLEHRDGNQWIIVDWDNGRTSTDLHCNYNKVLVN